MRKKKLEKTKITPTILSETCKSQVEHLLKLYETNKLAARIYVTNNTITYQRTVMFDESKLKFQIVYESITYFVNKNNTIFFRIKRNRRFLVNNGKFYVAESKTKIRPATITFLNETELKIIYERYPWIKFFAEFNIDTTLNICYQKKLFSARKVLAHMYKCPENIALKLHEMIRRYDNNCVNFRRNWIKYRDYITNVENLNFDLFGSDSSLFWDTCEMAYQLNKKINLAWSPTRLKNEHDVWAKQITKILLEVDKRELKVADIFIEFAKFAGLEDNLIKHTAVLTMEGKRQSNCVATYANNVDSGGCAIFHIEGYTAEIRKKHHTGASSTMLYIAQFKGYKNISAPEKLHAKVADMLDKFNNLDYQVTTESKVSYQLTTY